MYRTYPPELLNEIRDLLIRDRELNFQREGNYLRHGICPQCGKPEVFINLDEPYRMECGRKNKCGWNQTTRMRYPELFDNLSRRYSPTESNPNATADAYLKYSRGFDLEKIRGMYKQGYVHPAGSPERTYLPCIEVEIAGIPPEVSKPAKKTVWKRLIDEDDVKYAEKFATAKAKIYGGYKGYAWIPPQMRFNDKDEIWITEGIFKSMALMHVGKKSIAALSCSNFPREVVRKNAGRQIRWIVALDNDVAGIDSAERFLAELRGMNEECYCAIPPHEHEDWDDLYRKERLTENFLQRCIGEGNALQAPTQMRKAFMTYALLKWKYFVFEFGNVLYRCTVRDPDTTKEGEYQRQLRGSAQCSAAGRTAFFQSGGNGTDLRLQSGSSVHGIRSGNAPAHIIIHGKLSGPETQSADYGNRRTVSPERNDVFGGTAEDDGLHCVCRQQQRHGISAETLEHHRTKGGQRGGLHRLRS